MTSGPPIEPHGNPPLHPPLVSAGGLGLSGHRRSTLCAGIMWGKVVFPYTVATGLVMDCFRQAQPTMVHALVDCLGEFVHRTLAAWLRRHGGWLSPCTDPDLHAHWLVAVLCSFGCFPNAVFFMLLPER
uniref:Bcl-2 Bcl-2 homology region 1-3 domain-containing protein n=1 Tax=Sciurus vulgaris TaxID=55149 RepID=A0A8D2D4E0_SCIVU